MPSSVKGVSGSPLVHPVAVCIFEGWCHIGEEVLVSVVGRMDV